MAMKLTKRQRELLERMAAGEELVESGLEVWIGDERTNMQMLLFFLRNVLMSEDAGYSGAGSRYYYINEWGRRVLIEPDFDPQAELARAVHLPPEE